MWGLALLGVTLGRLGCSLYLLRAETQGSYHSSQYEMLELESVVSSGPI
jgi:hypothetical protein